MNWSLLEIAARAALLEYLGRSPFARTAPPGAPVRWVITGVRTNIHNGVCATRLDSSNVEAEVAATIATLAGYPAIWHVGPSDTPPNLPDRLVAAGCRPERTGVVMGAPIGAIATHEPAEPVSIREVLDVGAVEHWRRVAGAVWSEDPTRLARRPAQLYASLPLGPKSPWRHWLAWMPTNAGRREAVGMISAFRDGSTVLIEHVGVVPQHRLGGIGAALVSHVAHAVADTSFVVLGPTPETRPLYEALGFTLQPCVPDRQFYLPVQPLAV